MSTLSSSGQYTPGVITGKPLGSGGSLGRTEATGFGVIYTVREAMKHLKIDPTECIAAIQGFGNVAQYAAIGFIENPGREGGVRFLLGPRRPQFVHCQQGSGIDPHFLMTITDQYGSINKQMAQDAGYCIENGDAWITKEADVLIPSALEGQINADSVKLIHPRVSLIAEGANGPTTPEADEIIKQRGIFLIPDFPVQLGRRHHLLFRVGPERYEFLLVEG